MWNIWILGICGIFVGIARSWGAVLCIGYCLEKCLKHISTKSGRSMEEFGNWEVA